MLDELKKIEAGIVEILQEIIDHQFELLEQQAKRIAELQADESGEWWRTGGRPPWEAKS